MTTGRMRLCLIVASCVVSVNGFNYCSLTCSRGTHVLCGPEDRNNDCKDYKGGLSVEEQDYIVAEHNLARDWVARGKNKKMPAAADMMEVTWDDELAEMAQRWVDKCAKGNDPCRITSDNYTVGQNDMEGYFGPADKYSRENIIKAVVEGWYGKGVVIDPALIKNFTSSSRHFQAIGLFTQLIWAKITHVGCGMIYLEDEKLSRFRVVCNYEPAGNFNGEPIYQEGEGCSKCPPGSACGTKYPGLCKAAG